MDHAPQQAESPLGETLEVVHHEDERFYELMVDGLSNVMIQGTLDDVRAHGLTVTNSCPVLDHFFETHPGYIPLIDERVPGTWSRRDHEGRQASGVASRG